MRRREAPSAILAAVDDRRFGLVLRAVRRRRRLRQTDVAQRSRVSQATVSNLERGRVGGMTLDTVRSVGKALEVGVGLEARWRGPELARLLDEEHAATVERLARYLRARGWLVELEYGFNRYGDRGSVDVLGWQPSRRVLLIVEVKTSLPDLQDLFSSMARKMRVVPPLLRAEREWQPASVGLVLVVTGSRANRSVIERHRMSFDAVVPAGSNEVRAWLRDPQGNLAGRWLLSSITGVNGKQPLPLGQRIRRPVRSST